ncbi:integral membrane protein [Fusarium globosum]|uniref:Integral membrane protein n=1 Tax=Fusarium globosum TaxID=78864 RepID=A0A8H5XM89_9HYPO|nr:integral membrane protein [Fusarium globosum]
MKEIRTESIDIGTSSPDDDDAFWLQETKPATTAHRLSRLQKFAVTAHLSTVNFISCAANGLVVIGLPKMAEELNLPDNLAFWPSSVGGLATASTLLLAGSVADVVGQRIINLLGCLINGALMIGCGLIQEALVTRAMPTGRGRNIAFSCLGLSQPLGFSFGLVTGGLLVETMGWRSGWYLYGSSTLLISILSYWIVPKDRYDLTLNPMIQKLKSDVDWVGAFLASAAMTLTSYYLISSIEKGKQVQNIVTLCLGVVSLPLFIGWTHYRTVCRKPPLIPNSIWFNASFTSICGTIFLSFAVLNSLELFSSLFFQEVQLLSATEAAIRILPSLLIGVVLNLTTGLFVHVAPIRLLTICCSLFTAGAPLLMATNKPDRSYWYHSFPAQLLMPISCDITFTVGLIIITNTFPEDKQAVAGAVFNTATQSGNSFGLATMQVVSTLTTKRNSHLAHASALWEGYKASFWVMTGLMILCAAVGGIGLKNVGKIGLRGN